jgi:hypothetical protein
MVLYISFYRYNFFFQILAEKSNVLAFGFIKKRKFKAKTDRDSVFLGRDPQILDRLYLMVMYISFYGF